MCTSRGTSPACSLLKINSSYLVCSKCLVLCCVVIFTSEMIHGWMVIMKVMDHLLGFYFIPRFIRTINSRRSRYDGSGGLKSALCIE